MINLTPQVIFQCVLANHWPRGVQPAAPAGHAPPGHPGDSNGLSDDFLWTMDRSVFAAQLGFRKAEGNLFFHLKR